jgi:serine/threonine-protein phosphatase 2B regulatory subunit
LYLRFRKLDADGSGTIDLDEFLKVQSIALNPLVHRIVSVFDANGDNEVDIHEFVTAMATISGDGNRQAKLEMAFKVYDMDNDGFISNGELFQVLKMMVGTNLNDAQLQNIVDKTINQADLDGDGMISFQEFCSVRMRTASPTPRALTAVCCVRARACVCVQMVQNTQVEEKMFVQF